MLFYTIYLLASEANKQQCPMCKQNIAGEEDDFKIHLMGKDGCKQNPRRLTALNNKQQGSCLGVVVPGVEVSVLGVPWIVI